MSIRKVSNRGGNIIGHFPSLKLGRMVVFESLIERDFIYLLDYESGVEQFSEQPLIIRYQHGDKKRQYTPDFRVVHRGHNLLFECKPAQLVDDSENQIKFEAARLWCHKQGWTFRVVTDEYLASNWRVKNVKRLTQFARYAIGPEIKGRIFAFLSSIPGPVKVSDVMQAVDRQAPQSVIIPILHMAFHHEVYIPLNDTEITVNSPIALSNFSSEREALLP
jgi:hypothetical protein